jgi:hypothetical protein
LGYCESYLKNELTPKRPVLFTITCPRPQSGVFFVHILNQSLSKLSQYPESNSDLIQINDEATVVGIMKTAEVCTYSVLDYFGCGMGPTAY